MSKPENSRPAKTVYGKNPSGLAILRKHLEGKRSSPLDSRILHNLLDKPGQLHIAPADEHMLIALLSHMFDAAFRRGFIKFKEAASFALAEIRETLGNEAVDAITLDHLQGAYISLAGRYRAQGADSARDVCAVESKTELVAAARQAIRERVELPSNGMATSNPGPSQPTYQGNLPIRSRAEAMEEMLRTTPGLARAMLKLHDDANSDSEKIPDPTNEQMQAWLANVSRTRLAD